MHKDENALLGSIYQRVREIECRDILDTEESYFQQSLITAPDSLQAHNLFNTLRQNISTDIFLSLLDYDTFVKDLEEIGL
ncbi:hypothetical protein KZR87_001660 [Escherichia coli]|nr:hypothetical protein [Escherichia coli]